MSNTKTNSFQDNTNGNLFIDLFDSINQGVICYNKKGEVVKYNKVAKLLLGDSLSILSPTTIPSLFIKPDRKPLKASEIPSVIVFETGKSVINKVLGLNKNDRITWLQVSAIPEFDESNSKPCKVFVSFTDISEHINAQEKIKQTESFLLSVLNSNPSYIVVTDLKGDFKFVNRRRQRETNEQFFSINILDITHPAHRDNVWKTFLDAISTKEPQRIEFIAETDARDYHWYDVVFSPVVIDNEVKEITLFTYDIHKQKEANKKVQESEEKYRQLFMQNPQPMWIFDDATLQILEVNNAAINLYGYTRNEFLSLNIRDIRPKEDVPALQNVLNNAKERYNKVGVHRHLKKNGEIIYVEITNVQFMPATILIADDNEENRKLLIDLFEKTEITTIEAENGKVALEKAIEHKPNVILMDLRMPIMNGYEATKRIRQIREIGTTPIIAISASSKIVLKEQFSLTLFNDFLLKPIDVSALVNTLNKYIESKLNITPPKKNNGINTTALNTLSHKELQKLLMAMEQELFPVYETALKNQQIEQIELFGDELKRVGTKTEQSYLVKLGNDIAVFADSFDIEQLMIALNQFQEFIEHLKAQMEVKKNEN